MASEWTKTQVTKFAVLFDESDEDKNGSLRFREVVHALVRGGFKGGILKQRVMAMRQQFQMIDADKSGTLTRDEIMDAVSKAGINVTTEKISDLLIHLVKDADKKIEYEEFLKVYNPEK